MSFDVPDGWEDRSVVAFSAKPSHAGVATNVVLTRDALAAGQTLRAYGDRQLVELGRPPDPGLTMAGALHRASHVLGVEPPAGFDDVSVKQK